MIPDLSNIKIKKRPTYVRGPAVGQRRPKPKLSIPEFPMPEPLRQKGWNPTP